MLQRAFIPFAFVAVLVFALTNSWAEEVQRFTSAYPLKVRLSLNFDEGYHLNQKAPSKIKLAFGSGALEKQFEIKAAESTFELPVPSSVDFDTLVAKATVYFCAKADEGLCVIKKLQFERRFAVSNGSDGSGDTIDHNLIEFSAHLSPRPA